MVQGEGLGFNTSCPSLHSEEWGLPPHCEAVLCLVWGLVATLSPQGHNEVVVEGEPHGCMTGAQPAPGFQCVSQPGLCRTAGSSTEPFQGSGVAVSVFLSGVPLHSHLELGSVLYAESVSSPPSAFHLPRVC